MRERIIYPQKIVHSKKDKILYVLLCVGPSSHAYLGVELDIYPEKQIYPTLAEMLKEKDIHIELEGEEPKKTKLEKMLNNENNISTGDYIDFFNAARKKELSHYYSFYLTKKGEEKLLSKIKPESLFSKIGKYLSNLKSRQHTIKKTLKTP